MRRDCPKKCSKNLHFRPPIAVFFGLPKECSKNLHFPPSFAIFPNVKQLIDNEEIF